MAPSQWCKGNESGVYETRVHYTIGREIYDQEVLRREAEQCDRVEDFLIYSNPSGGTGAGLPSLFTDRDLRCFYPKCAPLFYTIVPSVDNFG